MADVLEREIASFPVASRQTNSEKRVITSVMGTQDIDDWLSVIEVICRVYDSMARENHGRGVQLMNIGASQEAKSALREINERFRENRLGYQYENGEIIRVDDRFIHAEVVKPVLGLLLAPGFEKPNEDFMTAHRHYREGHPKDAIVAANRAFESTMKAICALENWTYPEGARAAELVTAVRNQGLLPNYLDNGLDTYIAMLKTGLPGVRNNAGGHGEAPDAASVSDYLASYAIHLTASNIMLVINAHAELRSNR